jgi:vacuolar protein sorting-associated protein VTA1
MPLKIPPDLKKITQYIRRAEELDRDTTPQTRLVAYYCRQHAVQTGIPLATSVPARECLGAILDDLANEKKAMSNFSKEEGYIVCRKFAMKIFDKADNVDRMGQSNKGTAKSFYAAASFLDILNQFHVGVSEEDKSEDILEEEKKSFYAKWKATDILKAIREGREITPGGFGEDLNQDNEEEEEPEVETGGNVVTNEEEEEEEPVEEGTEVSFNEAFAPPPPYPGMTEQAQPPSAPQASFRQPKPVPVPAPKKAPSSKGGFMGGMFGGKGKGKYSKAVLGDAKELTKFALKALNEKDGDLAVERLQQALEALTQA